MLGISLAGGQWMRESSTAARAAVEARFPVDAGPPKHLAAVFATFLGTVAIRKQSGEWGAAFEAMFHGWLRVES